MTDQDRRITDAYHRDAPRLRAFIRTWLPREEDVEDVLQDVFSELVEAQRALAPLREWGAWMFRVARNRITDRFRKRRREDPFPLPGDGEEHALESWLPSPDAGPDALYARRVLLEELDAALEELPPEQRQAFLAHEVEGVGFKALAEATGVPVNTLISRKHYAVLHLRKRLLAAHQEFSHD